MEAEWIRVNISVLFETGSVVIDAEVEQFIQEQACHSCYSKYNIGHVADL